MGCVQQNKVLSCGNLGFGIKNCSVWTQTRKCTSHTSRSFAFFSLWPNVFLKRKLEREPLVYVNEEVMFTRAGGMAWQRPRIDRHALLRSECMWKSGRNSCRQPCKKLDYDLKEKICYWSMWPASGWLVLKVQETWASVFLGWLSRGFSFFISILQKC